MYFKWYYLLFIGTSMLVDSNMSDTNESVDVNIPSQRERTLTEKGVEYQQQICRRNFRRSISEWHRLASSMERCLSDVPDIIEIKACRDDLEHCMSNIYKYHDRLADLCENEDEMEDVDKLYYIVENQNYDLCKRIAMQIKLLGTITVNSVNINQPTRSTWSNSAEQNVDDNVDVKPVNVVKDSLSSPLQNQQLHSNNLVNSSPVTVDNANPVISTHSATPSQPGLLRSDHEVYLSSRPIPQLVTGTDLRPHDTHSLSYNNPRCSSRLPSPEPEIFTGDPLQYQSWKSAFETLIDQHGIYPHEKIYYLKKYVGGKAKECIEGCFLLSAEEGYEKAKSLLAKRFGDCFIIGEAFRMKAENWSNIHPRDGVALRRYADFLLQCLAAMETIPSLTVFNDQHENRRLLSKLPDWIITRWNRTVADYKELYSVFPPFKHFVKFVEREAEIACDPITSLQSLKLNSKSDKYNYSKNTGGARVFSTHTAVPLKKDYSTKSNVSCFFCQSSHYLDSCQKFQAMDLSKRKEFCLEKYLCFGCLRKGHVSRDCRRRLKCQICSKRHPTVLHGDEPKRDQPQVEAKSTVHTNSTFMNTSGISSKAAMIVPVWLSVSERPEIERLVYAMLDTQSDSTFVLEKTAKSIDAHGSDIVLSLSTLLAENKEIQCKKIHGLQVRAYNGSEVITLPPTYTRQIIPANRAYIPTPHMALQWPHLQGIASQLLPPNKCEIALLIGYNCSRALTPREVIPSTDTGPFAQRTDLGWGIVGIVDPNSKDDDVGFSHNILSFEVPSETSVEFASSFECTVKKRIKEHVSVADVQKLITLDFVERNESTPYSQDDVSFLKLLQNETVQRDDKHYEMPAPFRNENPCFPNNKVAAMTRLKHLEKRFLRDPLYYQLYKTQIDDMVENKFCEKVSEEDIISPGHEWYIPHHGVINPKKPNKLRIVFDCSARYQNTSLNDHLLKGPDLINSLTGVLIRFRKEDIALTCDIKAMFHQFGLSPQHRDYFRFLWWNRGDLTQDPSVYRMRVHLFGASSSPGCANYGLKRLADDYESMCGTEAANFIRNNFYVDDGVTSVATENEAIHLINQTREMCSKAGLNLHKFLSNSPNVIKEIPKDEQASSANFDLMNDKICSDKTLGIQWDVINDKLLFGVNMMEKPTTRRGILSNVYSIYDPLGFIAPVVLIGRQILQTLCTEGFDWDSQLPDEIAKRWLKWRSELTELNNFTVPRCVKPKDFGKIESVELHYFSDASSYGYGQCTYLRLISSEGCVHCTLVMAKGRVCPKKYITIPRLELIAAVLSTQIAEILKRELDYENVHHYFWSDSKIVLGYIKNITRKFHVFVANRIQQIRNQSEPSQWNYVTSSANPADLVSRGATARQLVSNKHWINGPEFLWEKDFFNNIEDVSTPIYDTDPEVKAQVPISDYNNKAMKTYVFASVSEYPSILKYLTKYSSWTKVKRIIAWCIRFKQNMMKRISKKTGSSDTLLSDEVLSVQEIQNAEITIIKMVQSDVYKTEIKELLSSKCGKQRSLKNSSLQQLDPFIDDENMLRVGGRLQAAVSISYGIKHPYLLPKNGHITHLIAEHFHTVTGHQGRGMTINTIRNNGIWIVGCSSVVSRLIHNCIICRKNRGRLQTQKMANLPADKLSPQPPFSYCGMDFFGPFLVKEGRKVMKRYGCVFICLASRAVHIEVSPSLSTDSFINVLRCFIAIRGPVRQLRCDQGTNFVGAQNELNKAILELDNETVKKYLVDHGCDYLTFKMNIPSSSHMSGSWERQIRTIRSILLGLMSQAGTQLDDQSLRTLMYEVMAIINSRPLCVDTLSDSSIEPLTPNQLLTLKSQIILPPPGNFERIDLYARKYWRRVQYLTNVFWSRWKTEFIHSLQSRLKWKRPSRNVQIGDVVILKEENMIRGQFQLARIHKLYPDENGLVRKVNLVLADPNLDKHGKRVQKVNYLDRPIHKLVVLIESQDQEFPDEELGF